MKKEIHLNEDQLREMVYNVIMEAADEGYLGNLLGRGVEAGKNAVKQVGSAIGSAAKKTGEAMQGAYNAAKEDYQNYNAAREPYKQAKKDAKAAYKSAKRMDRDVNGYKNDDFDTLDQMAQRYKPYDEQIAYLIGQVKNKIYQMSRKATSGMAKSEKAYGNAKQNLKSATSNLDRSYGRKPAAGQGATAPVSLEESVMAAVDKLLTEMTK